MKRTYVITETVIRTLEVDVDVPDDLTDARKLADLIEEAKDDAPDYQWGEDVDDEQVEELKDGDYLDWENAIDENEARLQAAQYVNDTEFGCIRVA